MASGINRDFFYFGVRQDLFAGSLNQPQVDGINTFLDFWESNFPDEDDRWLAYILATAYHEVDRRMQPIHEYGGNSYYFDRYDINGSRPWKAKELGNVYPGDGVRFHGRGFVQLTGRNNYTDWSNRLNVDLVNNPDLALDTGIAVTIIFLGMMNGTFTGKALYQYINSQIEDWYNARRVVNGTDQATTIKGYGLKFYSAISYTTA